MFIRLRLKEYKELKDEELNAILANVPEYFDPFNENHTVWYDTETFETVICSNEEGEELARELNGEKEVVEDKKEEVEEEKKEGLSLEDIERFEVNEGEDANNYRFLPNFPGYFVDREGGVYKRKKDWKLRKLKATKTKQGWRVSLRDGKKRVWRNVSTLVIQAWDNLKRNVRVKHKDGNKYNVERDNLKYKQKFSEALDDGLDYVMDWVVEHLSDKLERKLLPAQYALRFMRKQVEDQTEKDIEFAERYWDRFFSPKGQFLDILARLQASARGYAKVINKWFGSYVNEEALYPYPHI